MALNLLRVSFTLATWGWVGWGMKRGERKASSLQVLELNLFISVPAVPPIMHKSAETGDTKSQHFQLEQL